MSGIRIRGDGVPASWLDRLLVATCELPVADGERAVVEFLVKTLAEIFPERGVGACLVSPAKGQFVFCHMPKDDGRAFGVEPARLFPGFVAELVVPAGGASTLHLAADRESLVAEGSASHDLLRRAALAMERGVAFARAHERATTATTELHTLSSHMVQTEKLASLGQLAAGIVHELNNPLTSIVAYTDMLLKKQATSGGDPKDIERLRRIGESAGRMLRFTRDLITYARPSRETQIPVAIHKVVDQALAFCEHVIDTAHARLERRFAEPSPLVRGMPEQLAQVFVNLVTNACHAMPESSGVLVISTHLERESVVVVVEDNGHGIAPKHLPQIFTPFFTTKREGWGTGLGLSIVKNIVDSHGGDIRVEPRPGGGTRFILTFPHMGPHTSPPAGA